MGLGTRIYTSWAHLVKAKEKRPLDAERCTLFLDINPTDLFDICPTGIAAAGAGSPPFCCPGPLAGLIHSPFQHSLFPLPVLQDCAAGGWPRGRRASG